MTISDVIGQVMADLANIGIVDIDEGFLIQLARDAENDFAKRSNALFVEGSMNTTSATDYTLTITSPRELVDILAVYYNGKTLKRRTFGDIKSIPSYYSNIYKDTYCVIAPGIIRLGFTPAALTLGLGYFYSYKPMTAMAALSKSTVLSLDDVWVEDLVNYTKWKYFAAIPELVEMSEQYQNDYMEGVAAARLRVFEMIGK